MTDLAFGWEPVSVVFAEPNFRDLIREHWEDLGVHKDTMPLDPDYRRYIDLAALGYFKAWTARDGPTLAGYIGWFVQPHIHYRSTLTAVEDLYMLSAPYRKGLAGVRMFTTAIDALRELGVKRVMLHEKVHFAAERGGLGPLFKRLGFVHTDNAWSRML